MDIEEFTKKISLGMDHLNKKPTKFMSKPSPQMRLVYGPLTERVAKKEAWRAGIGAYAMFRGESATHPFFVSLTSITNAVKKTPRENGSSTLVSLKKIQSVKEESLKALDTVILDAKLADSKSVLGKVVVAAADSFILNTLSNVPFAGMIISSVFKEAIGAIAEGLTEAATAGVVAGVSASRNGAAGPASAITDIIAARAQKMDNDRVRQGQASAETNFETIINPQTQNQLAVPDDPKVLQQIKRSDNYAKILALKESFQPKEQTLTAFSEKSAKAYNIGFDMITDVAVASVIASFAAEIAKLESEMPCVFDEKENKIETKIALLIMGYFMQKKWGESKPDLLRNLGKLGRLETRADRWASSDPIMSSSAHNALSSTRGLLSRRNILGSEYDLKKKISFGDEKSNQDVEKQRILDIIKVSESSCLDYFSSLKNALCSDIETVLTINYGLVGISSVEIKRMWRLYVGSQLIVSYYLRELAIQTKSTVWKHIRNPGVQTLQIPTEYVKMIEAAGFVETYTGYLGITFDYQKDRAIRNRKLRMARYPSNHENIALITFATIVVYSVNVAQLSLGMSDWNAQKEYLSELCAQIGKIDWDKKYGDDVARESRRVARENNRRI